jgi:hypothetical protein
MRVMRRVDENQIWRGWRCSLPSSLFPVLSLSPVCRMLRTDRWDRESFVPNWKVGGGSNKDVAAYTPRWRLKFDIGRGLGDGFLSVTNDFEEMQRVEAANDGSWYLLGSKMCVVHVCFLLPAFFLRLSYSRSCAAPLGTYSYISIHIDSYRFISTVANEKIFLRRDSFS